jgi:hypothetical protein
VKIVVDLEGAQADQGIACRDQRVLDEVVEMERRIRHVLPREQLARGRARDAPEVDERSHVRMLQQRGRELVPVTEVEPLDRGPHPGRRSASRARAA